MQHSDHLALFILMIRYMWVVSPCNPSAEVWTAQPAEHFHVMIGNWVCHSVTPLSVTLLARPKHNKMQDFFSSNTYATVSVPRTASPASGVGDP